MRHACPGVFECNVTEFSVYLIILNRFLATMIGKNEKVILFLILIILGNREQSNRLLPITSLKENYDEKIISI